MNLIFFHEEPCLAGAAPSLLLPPLALEGGYGALLLEADDGAAHQGAQRRALRHRDAVALRVQVQAHLGFLSVLLLIP
jgi:hypothetical protein